MHYPSPSALAGLGPALALSFAAGAASAENYGPGTLIVPMDLAYQDEGLLQAYGLVDALLRHGVEVDWIIATDKSWHAAPCDTPGDECAWDCAAEGSGIQCPYPTASPDLFAEAEVVIDGAGLAMPGDAVGTHGYRGGPFVIDAAHADLALPIIEAWNDQALWPTAPWAVRSVFHVVTVHRATAAFTGHVQKRMTASPSVAVFADGNEDIATGYLRAAGLKQSNGAEFPAGKCGADTCGPGTANPDLLTVPSIMGEMGTCDAPNLDHRNGALFNDDGIPQYCEIMSMHWDVADRERVQCGGGNCPADPSGCAGVPITYHGHEVVAEVRAFLGYPTHFFAECQAVNAYENASPNPAWPYLDDPGRDGHYLTHGGNPPSCLVDAECDNPEVQAECVVGGCDDGARDCCLPKNAKEMGAGLLIGAQPASDAIEVVNGVVPFNQLDGDFGTTGGSEPAYSLSTFLGTGYKNDLDVTFLTGPGGVGVDDVWMTGYLDGACTLEEGMQLCDGLGKVSYLGGHRYTADVPVTANPQANGVRLFLNALFEADCVEEGHQALLIPGFEGDLDVTASGFPHDEPYQLEGSNVGPAPALDTVLTVDGLPGFAVLEATEGEVVGNGASFEVGSVGASGGPAGDPPSSASRSLVFRATAPGTYVLTATASWRSGLTTLSYSRTFTVTVDGPAVGDGDGDGDGSGDGDGDGTGDGDGDGDGPGDGDGDSVTGGDDPDGGAVGPGDGGAVDVAAACGCRAARGATGGPAAGLSGLLFVIALVATRQRRGERP